MAKRRPPALRPSPGLLWVAAGLILGGLGVAAWWYADAPSHQAADATVLMPSGAPPAWASTDADARPARVPKEPAATTLASPPQPAGGKPSATSGPAGPGRLPQALVAATAASAIPRQRDPQGDTSPDLADYINAGEHPTMNEVIARLHQAGVHTGLGAFNPPGTRPPLQGLAVPEDFVLPPGYVRHHQVTDDGQPIAPILMYSPDQAPPEAAHRSHSQPADRVVPPELAPPGLPLRQVVIPAPANGR